MNKTNDQDYFSSKLANEEIGSIIEKYDSETPNGNILAGEITMKSAVKNNRPF